MSSNIKNIVIRNKKAEFEFFLIEKFKCGLILTGTEIKSIRAGRANLSDAYCIIKDNGVWIRNLHVAHYKEGSLNNHEPKRERKLLLNKKEINKIEGKLKEKGLTLIPIEIFFNERGFAKMQISLAKGKKYFDKRATLKEKDLKREIDKGSNF